VRESPEAANAFEAYYDLGDERSLLLLAQMQRQVLSARYQGSTRAVPSEGTLLSKFKGWSTSHKWQERVIERDRQKAEAKRKRQEETVHAMNERQALIGTTQQSTAIKLIAELGKKQEFKPRDAIQLLKLAIDVERVARGAATEQIALTGKDGGPIEQDIIVETFWGRGTDPRRRYEQVPKPEEAEAVGTQPDQQLEMSIEFDDEPEENS
jgi:hypothetical protein